MEITYEEYKRVVEFLGIELIAVVLDLNSEFDNFKGLDLVLGAEDSFEEIEEYIDACDFDICKIHGVFWLNVNDYTLDSYEIIEGVEEISHNSLFYPNTNTAMNQIVLRYPNFIKLIS